MGADLYLEAQMRAPADLAAERAENVKLREKLEKVKRAYLELVVRHGKLKDELKSMLGYERVTSADD